MNRDPYTGTQTRFERTDRSGRYSPIHEPQVAEPWWYAVLGGAALGALLALGLYWGL